jgi:GT2 family glycosyltransferase
MKLLKECISAVVSQSYNLNRIVVIDNHSNDGTKTYLKELSEKNQKVHPIFLSKNIGGAGGFYSGIKYCMKNNPAQFLWIMDDDTVPAKDALRFLMTGISNKVGFCASNVRWIDGSAAKMNIPAFSRDANNIKIDNSVKITSASFVSLLINSDAVRKVGLPIKEFFIWGDDVEYTLRISNAGFLNYLCLKSIVVHKMKINDEVNIINENSDINRIDRYFYEYRNSVYRLKKQGMFFLAKDLIKRALLIFSIILNSTMYKKKKICIIIKGTFLGLFFNPRIVNV